MATAITVLLAILTLGGALMAVLMRRVLNAVFWLGLSIIGLAGLFLVLGSPFVGAMQMLIYIGGILILLVFAVMLSVSMGAARRPRSPLKSFAAFAGAALFFVSVYLPLSRSKFLPDTPADPSRWGVEQLGHMMLTNYDLVFEALSLLLVVAIMGAILIAHKDRKRL